MTVPSTTDPTAKFRSLVSSFTDDAETKFGTAHPLIQPGVFPPVADETADAKRRRAEGYVAAAIGQVGQAATWVSEQDGRDGYLQICNLMKTIATTADAVGLHIKAIVGPVNSQYSDITGPALQTLRVLNETLQALGALSPARVWARSSDPDRE